MNDQPLVRKGFKITVVLFAATLMAGYVVFSDYRAKAQISGTKSTSILGDLQEMRLSDDASDLEAVTANLQPFSPVRLELAPGGTEGVFHVPEHVISSSKSAAVFTDIRPLEQKKWEFNGVTVLYGQQAPSIPIATPAIANPAPPAPQIVAPSSKSIVLPVFAQRPPAQPQPAANQAPSSQRPPRVVAPGSKSSGIHILPPPAQAQK